MDLSISLLVSQSRHIYIAPCVVNESEAYNNNNNDRLIDYMLSFNGSTLSRCMTVFVWKIRQTTDGHSGSICLVNF